MIPKLNPDPDPEKAKNPDPNPKQQPNYPAPLYTFVENPNFENEEDLAEGIA